MDILQQCQKWHEEDKHQKSLTRWRRFPPRSAPQTSTWNWPGPTTTWRIPASRREESCFTGRWN